MLFNSFEFILVFLPIVLIGAYLLLRSGKVSTTLGWVVVCSLAFYAYWNPVHIWVITSSLLINFGLGSSISRRRERAGTKRLLLFVGVAFNLLLLGYFKYLGFFENVFTVQEATDFTSFIVSRALPIGISFYTFQQIAFLVDCYRGYRWTYNLVEYAFFVTFFPQLIAGPIVHHAEVIPQARRIAERMLGSNYAVRYLAPGLIAFTLGLGKKVVLADTFGGFADKAFGAALTGPVSFLEAWGGASAYAFQIYFDFSGYSDMAIGLGLLFGIRLPANFLSPYKARSIIDFWRRWHITLSRFLRHYLYIPLGGNRKGPARRYVNLLATMILGGFWHGANWNFILWGAIHGVLLALNHGLRKFWSWRPPVPLGMVVTFILVVFAWVPFRADNLEVTWNFYAAMVGTHGIAVPGRYEAVITLLGPIARWLNVHTDVVENLGGLQQLAWTAVGAIIVFVLPNTMWLMDRRRWRWLLTSWSVPAWGGFVLALSLAVMFFGQNTTFLYFQF